MSEKGETDEEEEEEENEERSPAALQVSVKVILASLPHLSRYFYHEDVDACLRGRKSLRIFAMSPIRSIMLGDSRSGAKLS